MSIQVIKPGLATSVQDTGRSGYYHVGIPPSGALDQYSYRAANLLLGNPEDAAALECTLMGPQLQFTQPTRIVITGAQTQPLINGEAHPLYCVLAIAAGDTLSFRPMSSGARAYIAVAGGIDVPVVLGSRSTYALGSLGGFAGRKLMAGDVLALGPQPTQLAPVGRELPVTLQTPLAKHTSVRVMPGLYDHRLQDASRQQFYQEDWKVASEADRIGYRFKGGTPLSFLPRAQPFGAGDDPSNIVDAGYPIGSIQVPAGKEPIILMRDAVSGGGYAMIATVISADLDLVAQLQPNYNVRFVPVDMAQALAARRDYQQRLVQLRTVLAA